MSFFSSRSSKGNHYKKGNNGSNHYKKKGLLGNLFEIIASRSSSRGKNYKNNPNQSSMMCSGCNHQIPPGSKFCLQCGQKVSNTLFCMSCGEKLPPGAKFCLKCGKKVND